MATTTTKKPAAKAKSTTKPAAEKKVTKLVQLDDLNHQPDLIDGLSNAAILKLAEQASDPDIPLAGGIRGELVRRAYAINAAKAD